MDTPQYRQNYIHWDHYYMGMAFLARHRSKDPAYQVGACIINEDKKVLGVGYNGMPTGCSDKTMPWTKNTPSRLDSKAFYVCHAELNAIMFRNSMDLKGCTMYVTLFPCNECAKLIIQAGIVKVVYFSDEKKEKDEFKAARKMFIKANVDIEEYLGKCETIELKFSTQNLSNG